MADNAGVLATLDKIIEQYSPGGGYATARGQEQEVLERKATAGKQQALVSGGLSGTTVAAAIPTSVYEEISQPFMTQTEQIRTSSLMDAYMAKAGYLQEEARREQELTLAQQQMEQELMALREQIEAEKYAAGMSAAAAVHGRRGGGAGGAGGGGSAQSMVDRWKSWTRGGAGGMGRSAAGGTGGFGSSSLFDDYSADQSAGGMSGTGGSGDVDVTGVWEVDDAGGLRLVSEPYAIQGGGTGYGLAWR